MRVRVLGALTSVAVVMTLTACGDDDDGATEQAGATSEAPQQTMAVDSTMAPDSAAAEPGTIVDVATQAGDFTTLVAAVESAGLVETLSGSGPFTVFAPTDEAFATALGGLGLTADELLADTAALTDILTYHVIPGEVPSSMVVTMDGQSATTVNGADVTISVDDEAVMVNEATVVATDVPASNGIIHVIDSVLLPPSA